MALEFGADLIYRQFPGWVGNLDNDGTTRTYTFLGRPWYENQKNQVWDYTQKSIMAPTAFGKSTSKYTFPYWSLDGNAWLFIRTKGRGLGQAGEKITSSCRSGSSDLLYRSDGIS